MTAALDSKNEGTPSSGLRTTVTLLLIVHLFFVIVSLTANLAPSQLQLQILDRFRVYTRLLNLDLNFTPYHLTHATEVDVDHRIEVLPADKDAAQPENWVVLPEDQFRGCDSYKRYQRLAAIWAIQAQTDGEPALFAQAIGTHFARERNVTPKQIRCRRHFLQSQDEVADGTPARRNPFDPSFFSVVYAANAIVSNSGYVDVVRIDEASQVALPTGRNNGARGPNNESDR